MLRISGSSQATTNIVRRVGGKRTSVPSRRLLSTSHSTLTRPPTLTSRRSLSSYSGTSHAAAQHRRGFHASSVVEKRRETFNLADIGEGITECEVIKWSLAPGTRISAFDPLCEVQSDKATVEITSPFDGVLLKLLVKEGEIAKVGAGLCVIEVDSEDGVAGSEHSSQSHPASTQAESNANTTSLDVKVAEEQTAAATGVPKRKLHPLDPSNPAPRKLEDLRLGTHKGKNSLFGRNLDSFNDNGPLSKGEAGSTGSQPSTGATSTNASAVLAPPSIRHLAKTLGVDLSLLAPGSGKEGRISQADLDAYLSPKSSSPSSPSSATPATSATNSAKAGTEDVVVELGRTRWNMYRAMQKSLSIPHFGYTAELDITELHALLPLLNSSIPAQYLPPSVRAQREPPAIRHGMVNPLAPFPKEQQGGVHEAAVVEDVDEAGQYTKLTYLPVLLKTLSKAMMEWPLLRSSISAPVEGGNKPTLSVRATADISLALSTPTGLYTPTLVAANTYSVYDLASRMKRLSELGRQVPCALTPTHMPKRGGTLTVSNVGAIGAGLDASPVLVEGGGVAIVALGRARWVLDVNDQYYNEQEGKRGERRLKLPVSWSADHRVVEGAELAAFVESWRGWVERPGRLVGEGV